MDRTARSGAWDEVRATQITRKFESPSVVHWNAGSSN